MNWLPLLILNKLKAYEILKSQVYSMNWRQFMSSMVVKSTPPIVPPCTIDGGTDRSAAHTRMIVACLRSYCVNSMLVIPTD